MKKKAARALAGVLTLSMAAALTACGGSDSAKKGGETAAAAERPYHRTDSFCYAF